MTRRSRREADPTDVSRRRFLGGAATLGAGAAIGAGVAGGTASALVSSGRKREVSGRVPFEGVHQAGITTPSPAHAIVAVFDSVATGPAIARGHVAGAHDRGAVADRGRADAGPRSAAPAERQPDPRPGPRAELAHDHRGRRVVAVRRAVRPGRQEAQAPPADGAVPERPAAAGAHARRPRDPALRRHARRVRPRAADPHARRRAPRSSCAGCSTGSSSRTRSATAARARATSSASRTAPRTRTSTTATTDERPRVGRQEQRRARRGPSAAPTWSCASSRPTSSSGTAPRSRPRRGSSGAHKASGAPLDGRARDRHPRLRGRPQGQDVPRSTGTSGSPTPRTKATEASRILRRGFSYPVGFGDERPARPGPALRLLPAGPRPRVRRRAGAPERRGARGVHPPGRGRLLLRAARGARRGRLVRLRTAQLGSPYLNSPRSSHFLRGRMRLRTAAVAASLALCRARRRRVLVVVGRREVDHHDEGARGHPRPERAGHHGPQQPPRPRRAGEVGGRGRRVDGAADRRRLLEPVAGDRGADQEERHRRLPRVRGRAE